MKSLLFAAAFASFLQAQGPPSLRIVVLEGEAAVNIIQQKTAVRPLVEVRDRNNVPVAGATVTFTIGTGQPAAFAGGVQTLSVTTNAAGQAAASGFNALGAGTVQMQVQAAYQGQIATAAISQTNFATATAAAQAGSAATGGTSGTTSTAAPGAAGGGGGISGTTIGIVGAAVAGGAVAATQISGGDGGDRDAGTTYTGSVSGQIVVTTTTTSDFTSTCVSTRSINGTLKITLQDNGTGFAEATGTVSEVSLNGSLCSPWPGSPYSYNVPLTGGPSALSFSFEGGATGSTPGGGGTVTSTEGSKFAGALSGSTITGTLTVSHSTRGNNVFNGIASTIAGNGSTTISVTLRQ